MSDFTLFNKKNTPSDKDHIFGLILIIASFFCYFHGCCHGNNDFNIESVQDLMDHMEHPDSSHLSETFEHFLHPITKLQWHTTVYRVPKGNSWPF